MIVRIKSEIYINNYLIEALQTLGDAPLCKVMFQLNRKKRTRLSRGLKLRQTCCVSCNSSPRYERYSDRLSSRYLITTIMNMLVGVANLPVHRNGTSSSSQFVSYGCIVNVIVPVRESSWPVWRHDSHCDRLMMFYIRNIITTLAVY